MTGRYLLIDHVQLSPQKVGDTSVVECRLPLFYLKALQGLVSLAMEGPVGCGHFSSHYELLNQIHVALGSLINRTNFKNRQMKNTGVFEVRAFVAARVYAASEQQAKEFLQDRVVGSVLVMGSLTCKKAVDEIGKLEPGQN